MAQVTAAGIDRVHKRFALPTSTRAGLLYVAAIVVTAAMSRQWPPAVYLLSFWHYYLYWLAFRYGAIPLVVFQRDALMMKTIALGLLLALYCMEPIHLLSAGAVTMGFALNALGARALGLDRTYYGHEVAGLRWQRVTQFPYSWVSHPMLFGNLLAFGGTLLNPQFREMWWPLASLHLAMNAGLLGMETLVAPLRGGLPGSGRRKTPAWRFALALSCLVAGAASGGLAGAWAMAGVDAVAGGAFGAAAASFACVLYGCYSTKDLE